MPISSKAGLKFSYSCLKICHSLNIYTYRLRDNHNTQAILINNRLPNNQISTHPFFLKFSFSWGSFIYNYWRSILHWSFKNILLILLLQYYYHLWPQLGIDIVNFDERKAWFWKQTSSKIKRIIIRNVGLIRPNSWMHWPIVLQIQCNVIRVTCTTVVLFFTVIIFSNLFPGYLH